MSVPAVRGAYRRNGTGEKAGDDRNQESYPEHGSVDSQVQVLRGKRTGTEERFAPVREHQPQRAANERKCQGFRQ